ncbi:MAG: HAMP domain-containing histidine kinase [Pirellulales bacterium]|nr:HAMP domain-containing histidine kinase [Pirellulales bacterium]
MRWPIRTQLLLWMVSVVFLGIVLTTLASVYLAVADASRRQAGQLRRVVAATTDPSFPLTESVLDRMRGLSGGEFVVLDEDRHPLRGTIEFSDDDRKLLESTDLKESVDPFSSANVVWLSGRAYFADLVPVRTPSASGRTELLLVLYPKNRWWSIAREVALPIVLAGAITMAVGGLAAAWVASRLARPIKVIGSQATAVAAGRFEPMPVPKRNDELSDLATSINTMTQRLSHYEEEVRRTERMRTLGQLGAGMAHQLRNSATGIRMAVELHQRECPTATESESTAVAMRELRLMESYLRSFLDLGLAREVPHERVELERIIRSALELVRPTCRHAGIELECHTPGEPVWVEADDESIRQLLINLLLNAAEAVGRHGGEGARVVVELEKTGPDAAGSARAMVRVKDSGPGPSEDVGERLFEPFITEKPDGTGLGLYVARQIVEAHGGSIAWDRLDEMTRFTVELPLSGSVMDSEEA